MIQKTIKGILHTCRLTYKYLLQLRQKYSHYGTIIQKISRVNVLKIRISILIIGNGMLYAYSSLPNFKRKIEMDNFEGKVNFNLLHTYLYVSYLDALKELNKIELKNQKNSYLEKLCTESNFTNNLCLNLIMSENDLIKSFNESIHSK